MVDDDNTSTASSESCSDLDFKWSRQTSWTSVESDSPSRKRQPESRVGPSTPNNLKLRRTSEKSKIPAAPLERIFQRETTPSPSSSRFPTRSFDRTISNESASSFSSFGISEDSIFTSSPLPMSRSNSTGYGAASPPVTVSVSSSATAAHAKAVPVTAAPYVPGQQSFFDLLWGHGTELPVYQIAHNQDVQRLFDHLEKPVPWGTQFELARGVTAEEWTWEDVLQKIHYFGGMKDADVLYKVRNIMREVAFGPGPYDDSIGKEFDREQKAIAENRQRGLGLMGRWEGEDDWHGGQIQQIARLVKIGNDYSIKLEALEMRRSTRFARHVGSRRLLQIRIDDGLLSGEPREGTIKFLSRKLVLNGRVFIATSPKDDGLYAVEINEDFGREPRFGNIGDQFRMHIGQFLEWHNPMELNDDQPIAKYFARAALGLSNSTPVIEFEESDIKFIRDIVIKVKGVVDETASHQILTDGCGIINDAALYKITRMMKYSSLPTAIQARVAGSKGLFVRHPDDDHPQPKIWIRDSQRKIKYLHLSRAHRILDLVAVSHPSPVSSSIDLSQQSVVNMEFNGVPAAVFEALMEQGLKETIEPLLNWESRYSMIQLWDTINRTGAIATSRLSRLAPMISRAMGFSGREWVKTGRDSTSTSEANKVNSKEKEEKEDLGLLDSTGHSGRNECNGAPLSLHEYALEMVQAGFNPRENEILLDKVKWILKNTISTYIEKCHIPLPDGTGVEAFVIPDPLGVLKQGQIYYRSSNSMINPETQTLFNVVKGEVLIGRYPIRLPSDIQKVTAVDIPALEKWPDVVIVPVVPVTDVPRQGEASFMSLLSGGDMDGDTVFMTWYKPLVDPFKNKSLSLPPPNFEQDNFERLIERVPNFMSRILGLSVEERQLEFQRASLFGLAQFNVGMYSVFHDTAVWHDGYGSDKAIRLAYMFNAILDSGKTGLRLKPDVYSADRRISGNDKPFGVEWKPSSERLPKRPGEQRPFILDVLAAAGEQLGTRYFMRLDDIKTKILGRQRRIPPDPALLYPLQQAESAIKDYQAPLSSNNRLAMSQAMREALTAELDLIKQHVDRSWDAFRRAVSKSSSTPFTVGFNSAPVSPKKPSRGKKASKPDIMREAIVLFAQEIPGVSLIRGLGNLEKVKASYAYSLSGKFGFCVAYKQLCAIKAEASLGGSAPSIRLLDEVKSIPGSCRRLYQQSSTA
ncbi:hypothetical protein VKT23_012860 [Stygiomarasmius scandens]|uniref:RNA-dependent RNA polymerase n=1 Tax=Marasmiellus scandens TaxID=2682957 RepID=A0ABR1J7X9_9AGAR